MREEIKKMLSAPRRIHMLGIGGIGMAGLAFLLKERGHEVSGCDAQNNRQTAWLREKGICVLNGHDPAHLDQVDWVIRTTAVPDDHPEVAAASVPVSRRGEVLPALLEDRFTIAVSGTHGKTTTTAMIAQILQCGYCIGGEVQGFDGTARDGDVMAVEADESDGTVANYHPDIAVITNIEYDHMEHHENIDSFESCFRKLIAQTKEKVVFCGEDAAAVRLCRHEAKAVAYGFKISDVEFQVALPGRHNRLNALAAAEVCKRWKTRAEMATALAALLPVKRRFEVVCQGDYTVISDYAHHPTEIRALIQTAIDELAPKRLLAVFQPHRYTRTRALLKDFPPAFEGLDRLWLVPVYAASEKPLAGGTSRDLFQSFPGQWESRLTLCETLEESWQRINRELRKGDVLLMIGAGDVEQMAEWINGKEE